MDMSTSVRGALVSFLQPEVLKQYVGKIDEVWKHFEMHWHGKQKIRTLTFNILSSLIIGIEQGEKRDILVELFQQLLKGVLSEIVDNVLVIMIAGYDTSSILLTFLIGLLANNPSVYASICQEQEKIVRSKTLGELLTWDDLARGSLKISSMKDTYSQRMADPSKFEPRHFEKSASLSPYSFVALCGGHRICPGYEFARLETLITIHYLVNRFTWKLCCQNISFSRDPMPTFKDGLDNSICFCHIPTAKEFLPGALI
ncbi:hypothetical protein POTOM_039107 [Populus tomentosa]|uniref:Cytochrome P450 n=1 Tax=Populus tomentosa TaxID=118781 RepID=A0A8X8CIR7_POPTO|nr:hypothetical protein POTOM_039107 [Populus tomentosa]